MKKKKCLTYLLALRDLPVFWKSLIMMLCILILSMGSLFLNSYFAERALTQNYLRQAEITLQQNVETMSSSLYATYAIPKAVESTEYYRYMRTVMSGTLPESYRSVLLLMREALQNQVYLFNQCEECVLYFRNTNSITTRSRTFRYAEDCFEDYIVFSETSLENVMERLNQKGVSSLLPMQDVVIEKKMTRCMPLFVHPIGSSMSVITLFSEKSICGFLGLEEMPEGTQVQMEDFQGQTLFSWSQGTEAFQAKKRYEIQVEDPTLHFVVTVSIPESYFEGQLADTRRINGLCVVITVLLGVALSVVLSGKSAKPWEELLFQHGHRISCRSVKSGSEVTYLASILEGWQDEASGLQSMLLSSMLTRVLSGAILSESEEHQLGIYLQDLGWPCHLALIHSDETVELLLEKMQELPKQSFFYQPVSTYEIGVLFPESESCIGKLTTFLQSCIEWFPEYQLLCGISSSVQNVAGLHEAVRQARLVMPREPGVQLYSGLNQKKCGLSWLMHERVYQCVLAADKEAAIGLLRQIAEEHYRGFAAREAFFNICFVLRSAAEELDIELPELNNVEYDTRMLARENILGLEELIHVLFQRIRMRQESVQSTDRLQDEIMGYLKLHFADYDLCATSVAQACDCSEKRVYQLVRQAAGQSLNEYLLSLRMEHAGKLLCSTNGTMGEIANSCGYEVESTFYRAFKKYYEITPAQYRKCGGDYQRKEQN